MQLKQVLIRGFRSIKDQRIQFRHRFQILVGINESGKTNVLKALRLIDEQFPPVAQDQRNPLQTEAANLPQQVNFEFELSPAESKKVIEQGLSCFLVRDRSTSLGVRKGAEISVQDFVHLHKTPLIWANLKTLERHVYAYAHLLDRIAEGWYLRPDELTGLSVSVSGGAKVPIEQFRFIYAPDFPEIPIGSLAPLEAARLSAKCNDELSKLLKAQIPACIYWTYEERFLLPPCIGLSAFASSPETCIPLKEMFRLADIQDINTAITQARDRGTNILRNLLERVAERATAHVRQIWREYKNVTIKLELNGDNVDASIIDHFNRFNFADRSDGFKRFVAFLLVVSARARTNDLSNTLILIDEAEIGLHPSGVKYLRDELKKIAENNFVVVSTHSIFMVDRDEIGRHLIVKKNKEITEITPVDSSNVFEEEVVYNALNHSVFEVLKPFNLIFEGWRDKRLFEVAITKPQASQNVELDALGSAGRCHLLGVNDAGRVVPILELADRAYALVTDSDDAAVQAKKKFRGSGSWLTYADLKADKRTFLTSEDFVRAQAFDVPLRALAKRYAVEPLKLDDETTRKPRIPQIKSWLQSRCNLEGDALKEALDELKEQVFVNMEALHVLPEYFDALEALAQSTATLRNKTV